MTVEICPCLFSKKGGTPNAKEEDSDSDKDEDEKSLMKNESKRPEGTTESNPVSTSKTAPKVILMTTIRANPHILSITCVCTSDVCKPRPTTHSLLIIIPLVALLLQVSHHIPDYVYVP